MTGVMEWLLKPPTWAVLLSLALSAAIIFWQFWRTRKRPTAPKVPAPPVGAAGQGGAVNIKNTHVGIGLGGGGGCAGLGANEPRRDG